MNADLMVGDTFEKLPAEPYQEIFTFSKTEKMSFFKINNYKASVSLGLNSSRMPPILLFLTPAQGQISIKRV